MRVNKKKTCLACYCSSCCSECTCLCDITMEQDANKYSLCNLRSLSYRYLQQMAKSMNLPSNVKKMYLIELINAKKFKSPRELNDLIHRVKLERKQQAKKGKKNRVQGAEISSTSNSSPPITRTPKRHKCIMKRSPDYTKTKYNTAPISYNTLKVYPPSVKSDRVLRSFRDRPNYRILNTNNTVIGVIKAQSPKTKINIISRGTNRPKFNVTAIVKKLNCDVNRDGQLLVPYSGSLSTPSPRKLQRRLSGISPLNTPERPCIFTPTVNFTRRDGRTSKINALVHKSTAQTTRKDIRNVTYKMDEKSTLKEYDSINKFIQGKIETAYVIEKNQNVREVDNEYLHKKIRADHVRSVKVTQVCAEERLPCINDVFSKFNDVNLKRFMQPIHVEVSTESERTLNFPPYLARNTTNTLLESLYNIRSELLTNQPLLQIAPAANTKCVFSTPTISSTMQQPTAMIVNEYNTSYPRDNPYETSNTSRINDYLRAAENEPFRRIFTCDEVLSSSSSSIASGRELSASATIPEMVEDAFELISQDGDYMERIGMDERMQCFLCTWAGPKFILEHHIRKEHPSDIECAESGSCRLRFSLGALAGGVQGDMRGDVRGGGGVWSRRVMSCGGRLFVLSAMYEDPHHFMAALHTLTDEEIPKFGKITIYNKVSGEPYVWEGGLSEITDSIPRGDSSCFRLDLSKMNLLPNSANLMLINRELVVMSPNKVIVGSPALNDIYIELFVQIWG